MREQSNKKELSPLFMTKRSSMVSMDLAVNQIILLQLSPWVDIVIQSEKIALKWNSNLKYQSAERALALATTAEIVLRQEKKLIKTG